MNESILKELFHFVLVNRHAWTTERLFLQKFSGYRDTFVQWSSTVLHNSLTPSLLYKSLPHLS